MQDQDPHLISLVISKF